jgi:hypothetical protein
MMPYPHYQAGILADSPVNFSAYRPSNGASLMACGAIRPMAQIARHGLNTNYLFLLKQSLTGISANYSGYLQNNLSAYRYIRALFIKQLSSISSIMRGQINF